MDFYLAESQQWKRRRLTQPSPRRKRRNTPTLILWRKRKRIQRKNWCWHSVARKFGKKSVKKEALNWASSFAVRPSSRVRWLTLRDLSVLSSGRMLFGPACWTDLRDRQCYPVHRSWPSCIVSDTTCPCRLLWSEKNRWSVSCRKMFLSSCRMTFSLCCISLLSLLPPWPGKPRRSL